MKVMSTPRSLDLSITGVCNLRCLYCSHFSSAADTEEDLPLEEWLTFFEELGRCSVMSVVLGGGEPFCRKDIREIINGLVRNRMRYSINTNGTLVTDDLAEFIASTKRCDSVQVSIDGSTPITHDVCRGKGNFDRAMAGIKHLQKHKVPLTVRVTIHKGNVNDLENVAKLLLEDVGLSSFSTNAASHMGLCRRNAELVQLSAKDRSLAMKILLKLAKKYNGRITATAGPLAEAQHWLEIMQARAEGKESTHGGGFLTGCGGACSKLAVRPDGVIIPCVQLSHMELGRMNRDDLKEIWQHHPELTKLRERGSIPLKQFEYCRDCDYIQYCTGNCPALAYTLTGDAYQPSPDACFRRFIEEGGSLPDMTS
jgi:SynChlorMet cassette radical SAM/SPASM protein ScmE